jgi:hypothetical protein
MTITDPTALHSPKRSIVSKATQWTIDALAPLREHLSPWPAVLPSEVGDPIRPLKIGVRADLAILLPDGEAHEVLSRVLRRYTRGREYLAALAACKGRMKLPQMWRVKNPQTVCLVLSGYGLVSG